MKILITETKDPTLIGMGVTNQQLQKIKKILPKAKITLVDDTKDTQKYATNAEIIITDNPLGFDYPTLKSLKWVHVSFAGIETLPKDLMDSNILLTNSSGVHPIPIAEHVLALMLMFSHQFHKLYRQQVEKGEWKRDNDFVQIDELYGKSVGIVGLGRIGQRIAHLCKAFNMKVIGLVRSKQKKVKNVDMAYSHQELIKFLKQSDFVVNCLPLTKKTKELFSIKAFKNMKRSVYFINIGRGRTVVEKDLIQALENDIIAGAGLDVFEVEPLPKSSPLWRMKNVIITPHSSGQTPYYMDRVINIFCENLKAYLKGAPMPTLVDKKRGY